ncbi:MAG: SDR family oxidoreductase [bacterium]
MDLGLKEKVALVTGASAGLGFAAARALALEGARLAICSRSLKHIEAAAEQLREETGAEVHPTVCDVTDTPGVVRLVEDTRSELGALDVLVCSAGGPPGGRFEDLGPEEWERAYNLTFQGTLHLCQSALPIMTEQGRGSIVVLTSLAAKQPVSGLVTSNTFRAGLMGLIKSIADEYGDRGIRANTVAPGYTRTERLNELAEGIAGRESISIQEVFARWEQLSPMGRIGEPEEIGAAVAFLASEQASFITGQHLAVDGGAIRGLMG